MKSTFNDAIGDSKSGFVYSALLMFAYLAYAIVGLTVTNLIFTGLGVFGALAFLMDLRMAVFIVCIIAMINIGVCAFFLVFDVFCFG